MSGSQYPEFKKKNCLITGKKTPCQRVNLLNDLINCCSGEHSVRWPLLRDIGGKVTGIIEHWPTIAKRNCVTLLKPAISPMRSLLYCVICLRESDIPSLKHRILCVRWCRGTCIFRYFLQQNKERKVKY